MKRTQLLLPIVLLALLALACDGGAPTTPSPAAPTPAATPTPAPREVVGPRLIDEPFERTGGFLADLETGDIWWLRDLFGPWSPDSRYILVSRCCLPSGGLEVVEMPGGPALRIVEGPISSAAAWSPDGRRIAFSGDGEQRKGIYIVNRDGTGLRQVTRGGSAASLEWAGDGQYIVYNTPTLLRLSDGKMTTFDRVGGWAVSPDGWSLALAGEDGVDIYDIASGERRTIAPGPAGGPIVWSPDGSRLLVPYGEREAISYGLSAGTPEAGNRPFHLITGDGSREPVRLGQIGIPVWSPDGSRFAYLGEVCEAEGWDIYIASAEDGQPRRLVKTPAGPWAEPTWSPDSKRIAFGTFGAIRTIDVDARDMRDLLTAEDNRLFRLAGTGSPDGRFLEFSSHLDGQVDCDY